MPKKKCGLKVSLFIHPPHLQDVRNRYTVSRWRTKCFEWKLNKYVCKCFGWSQAIKATHSQITHSTWWCWKFEYHQSSWMPVTFALGYRWYLNETQGNIGFQNSVYRGVIKNININIVTRIGHKSAINLENYRNFFLMVIKYFLLLINHLIANGS